MLRNILINEGRWTNIATAGNHINIVLAAGEVMVRAELENGRVYATPAVQGMALELPRFKNVQVSAKTSQQTKVWVGDVPLSYSPADSRAVGSNALRSSVGYVYSGYPHALLPAEIGRNKITLTPNADIYIGGTNLNTKNGVLLKAGQVFSLATQGAVYALETSGAYQPYFTALTNPSELVLKEQSDGKPFFGIYFENKERTRGWGYKVNGNVTGGQTQYLYEYDPATLEPTGERVYVGAGSASPAPDDFYYQGSDNLVVMRGSALTTINLNTGESVSYEFSNDAVNVAGERIARYAHSGQFEYIYSGDEKVYRNVKGGEAWELVEDSPPPFTQGYGLYLFEVTSNGRILVANSAQLWFKDEGSAWVQGAMWDNVAAVKARSSGIDLATNHLYAGGANGVYKSTDGGASWALDFDTTATHNGRNLTTLTVLNGAVLAVGVEGYVYRNPITGEYTSENIAFGQRNCDLACISESGRVFFSLIANYPPSRGGDGHVYLNVKGTPSPVAGLPVSIMAEVN